MNQDTQDVIAFLLFIATVYMLVYIWYEIPVLAMEYRMWRRRRANEAGPQVGHGRTPWREQASPAAGLTYPEGTWLP